MGDYMFMLESRLSADQFRALGQVQTLAGDAGMGVYLTGGAMRDMLGGFPVRDLDFTVEGNALKLAKALEKAGIEVLATDDARKALELRFPGDVSVGIAMARTEKYAKSGGKVQISPATIHDDLRSRDFTINSIALSLNKASMCLPIDPTNGIGDIERKEVRAVHNYSFYDAPDRMLRLIRYKVRLGYGIDERTKSQYENAREAGMLEKITPDALAAELRLLAKEILVEDIVRALDEEKLLTLFSVALTGAKIGHASLGKLQKTNQMLPLGWEPFRNHLGPFLEALTENLTPKDRAAITKGVALTKAETTAWQKAEANGKKAEKDLKNPKLQKPSLVYQAVQKTAPDTIVYLSTFSDQRLVQDRIKNYFGKYLPAAQEVTDEEVAETGVAVGTPKFAKAKAEFILKRLDARPKKVEPPPEPPPAPPMSGFARGPSVRTAR